MKDVHCFFMEMNEKLETIKNIIKLLVSYGEITEIDEYPANTSSYPYEDSFVLDSMEIKGDKLILKYMFIEIMNDRGGSIVGSSTKDKKKNIDLSEVSLKITETDCTLIKEKESLCCFSLNKLELFGKWPEFNELSAAYRRILRAERRAETKALPKPKVKNILKAENAFSNDKKVEFLRVDYAEVNEFESCTALKKLFIGPKVKVIGPKAFKGCNQLSEIVFEDGCNLTSIAGFSVCSGLKNVNIPSSVEEISGFYNCTGLEKVVFTSDSKISRISGFQYCGKLKQIDMKYEQPVTIDVSSVASKVQYFFDGVTISDILEVKSESDLVKVNDTYKKIIFDDSLVLEKLEMTEEFRNLEYVYIGKGIKSLGENNFCNCESLKDVQISEESELEELAGFNHNPSLVSINVPSSVKIISGLNFCKSLAKVSIDESCEFECIKGFKETSEAVNLSIKSGSNIRTQAFSSLKQIAKVCVHKNLEEIPDEAFKGCEKLKIIEFHNESRTAKIGNEAFADCKWLTSIVIPGTVKEIGDRAFQNCFSLESIQFEEGSQLEKIGSHAFKNCSKLSKIVLPKRLKSFSASIFSGCVDELEVIIER